VEKPSGCPAARALLEKLAKKRTTFYFVKGSKKGREVMN